MTLKAYVPEHRTIPLDPKNSVVVHGLNLEAIILLMRNHHHHILSLMDTGVDVAKLALSNLPMAYELIALGIVGADTDEQRAEAAKNLATYPSGHVLKMFMAIWELSFIDLADVIKLLTTLIEDADEALKNRLKREESQVGKAT